ncbi:MAG: universal stress protein [Pirellulaceae bacterium]|nr:universal stress protein [Pirellulaceae bacterium]
MELNNTVFELAKNMSHYHGGFFSIIHAWSIWNSQMLRHRMAPEAFAEIETANREQVSMLLSNFLKPHGSDVSDSNIHLLYGEAPQSITDFIGRNDVDLVVMGTIARSGLSGIVMGNTAEQILNTIECSVLALKPSDFVSPVKPVD